MPRSQSATRTTDEEEFHDARESLDSGSAGEPCVGGPEPTEGKDGGSDGAAAEDVAQAPGPASTQPLAKEEEWPALGAGKASEGGATSGRCEASVQAGKPGTSPWGSRRNWSPQRGARGGKAPAAPAQAAPQRRPPRDRPAAGLKFRVQQEHVGRIIGRGGEVLRSIIAETGAKVDIDQSSRAKGYCTVQIKPGGGAARARELIEARVQAANAMERGEGLAEMRIEQSAVGLLVGRRGECIQRIDDDSGACLKLDQSTKDKGFSTLRLAGTPQAIQMAMAMVKETLEFRGERVYSRTEDMRLNQDVVGLVIGPGGETLRSIQSESGAHLFVDQSTKDRGYSTVRISADDDDAIDAAKEAIIANTGGRERHGHGERERPGHGERERPGSSEGEIVCKVDQSLVGLLLTRSRALKQIQDATGCFIAVDQSTRDKGHSLVRVVPGPGAQRARELISAKIRELEAADSEARTAETEEMRIEQRFVRRWIKEDVRKHMQEMEERSGAHLFLDRSTAWLGFSTLCISGSKEAAAEARATVQKKLASLEARLEARAAKRRTRKLAARDRARAAGHTGQAGAPEPQGPEGGSSDGSDGSSSASEERPEGPGVSNGGRSPPSKAQASDEGTAPEPLCQAEDDPPRASAPGKASQAQDTDSCEEVCLTKPCLSSEVQPEGRPGRLRGIIAGGDAARRQASLKRLHDAWMEEEEEGGKEAAAKSEEEEREHTGVTESVDAGAPVAGAALHHGSAEREPSAETGAVSASCPRGPLQLAHGEGAGGVQAAEVAGHAEAERIAGGAAPTPEAPPALEGVMPPGFWEVPGGSHPEAVLSPEALLGPRGEEACGDSVEEGEGWPRADSEASEAHRTERRAAAAEIGGADAAAGGGDAAAGGPPCKECDGLEMGGAEALGGAEAGVMCDGLAAGCDWSGQWFADPWAASWWLGCGVEGAWLGEPWQGVPGRESRRPRRRGGQRHRERDARRRAADRAGGDGCTRSCSPRAPRSGSRDGGRHMSLLESSSDESSGMVVHDKPKRALPRQPVLDESSEGPDNVEGKRSGTVSETMKIPQDVVGWLIGRGGSNINEISAKTLASLHFDRRTASQGFSLLRINGRADDVARAKGLVEEHLAWEREGARARSKPRAGAWAGEGGPSGSGGARRRSRSPLARASWSPAPAHARVPVAGGSLLLKTVLSALLGRWRAEGAAGPQRFEVAVGLMPSRPNGAQLCCRTLADDGARVLVERPIRYESGDIFLGERARLFLDFVNEDRLAWVDERDPGERSLWMRGWGAKPRQGADGAGGWTADEGQAETSGAEFDTEAEGDFPAPPAAASADERVAQDGPPRGRGRLPRASPKQLAMQFQ